MSREGTPQVELDVERDFCARHLEPFRDHWPAGVGVAMTALFGEFVHDPRTPEMLPHDAEGKADAHALQALILETSPLCCWLPDEAMARIYKLASEATGHPIDPPE